MFTKLFTAFIVGAFFTFFLDFFLILGVFLNYIKAQGIDVYYNVLFADHQSMVLYLTGVAIFGYLFVFFKSTKTAIAVFSFCFIIINLSQIPSVGKFVGDMMFAQENKVISQGTYTYIGTIVYEGRDTVWFHDDELNKIITFEKESISEQI